METDNSSLDKFLSQSSHPDLIDITSLLNYSESLCSEVLSNTKNLKKISFQNHFLKNPIRELKSKNLKKIISTKGTVTRVSQVRPELVFGVFNCLECRALSKEIEQQFCYILPPICENKICTNREKFQLNEKFSTFVDFQKISVQELTEENISGDIPRTIEVILRDKMVDSVKPGQKVNLIGEVILLPDVSQLMLPQNKSIPSLTGASDLNSMRRRRTINFKDLNYKFGFLAYNVEQEKGESNDFKIIDENIIKEENSDKNSLNVSLINKLRKTTNLYEKISNSLFPSITGHDSIKKAILLQLIGGVQKDSHSNIRGDINILLVGDPGTAKSQFLKQASCILQGSVYTSGKSASSAGLTAAVIKDGSEFVVEAGALILADNSLCCIDEFGKMDIKDRVSIHEAMEQQTITINKAEIQCTLNARASVLAAGNPVNGRYDKTKLLKQNINLSQPIISRFDLYFVLIDEPDIENDEIIARQVIKNHTISNETEFTLKECIEYVNFV